MTYSTKLYVAPYLLFFTKAFSFVSLERTISTHGIKGSTNLCSALNEPTDSNFGRQEYWNDVYKKETSFSWYCGYDEVKRNIDICMNIYKWKAKEAPSTYDTDIVLLTPFLLKIYSYNHFAVNSWRKATKF